MKPPARPSLEEEASAVPVNFEHYAPWNQQVVLTSILKETRTDQKCRC